jgi:TonB family protein
MKKTSTSILLIIWSLCSVAQTDSHTAFEEIRAFQRNLNESFKDVTKSPLMLDDILTFEGLDFFPVDLAYRVNATLTATDGTPFLDMRTTTDELSKRRVYGYISFSLKGSDFRLPVYQSEDLLDNPGYADYLVLPFTDLTNGEETYSGGRYIDLRVPKKGNNIIIDFNMAYNPYCAYSSRYSCLMVPLVNDMDIEIPAGVRYHPNDYSGPAASDRSVHMKVDVEPEYPGGLGAMANFVKHNMRYPKKARKAGVEGMVYIAFVVTSEGEITDVKTIKGISPECDAEARRVVMMMPRWKPGQLNGRNVFVRFVLPIKFRR